MLKCFGNLSNHFKFKVSSLFRHPSSWKSTVNIRTNHIATIAAPSVRVRKAHIRDIPKVLKMIQEQFWRNESLVDGLKMSNSEYSPALLELWRNYIQQGMTLIVTPQKDQGPLPILGAVVNTKLCSWDPDLLDKFAACIRCPKTSELIHLWALFIRESKVHEKYGQNTIFNITHVIVNEALSFSHSAHLSKVSLAKLLVGMSMQLAQSRGFNLACMTCTSNSMAEVASDTGMDLAWEYPFEKLLNNKLTPIVQWRPPDTHVKVFAQKF